MDLWVDTPMVDASDVLIATVKFGGHWVEVRNEDRRRYDGGKQRTIKLEKDLLSFFVLRNEVETLCPWLRGHAFKLHNHVCGTSPKQYVLIESDIEVMKMIEQSYCSGKVEIVVVIEDDTGDGSYLEGGEGRAGIECSHSSHIIFYASRFQIDVSNEDFDVGQGANSGTVLCIGARFQDSLSFKQALRSTAITNNFGVKIKCSDRTRVIAICSHQGCPWRVRASLCQDGTSFEIRKLEATHSCPGVNRAGNKLATSTWVAHVIQDIVKKNPDISPKHIKHNLETTYGLSLPYMKLWRSREHARSIIFGEVDHNYKLVPALREELISRNPGSHITYAYNGVDNSFKRLYVSFKVCIDGFLAGCRRLIGLDACHLKLKYLGMLLSANCLDGNNGLFTLAFAVVESESKTTWEWFLCNLVETIGSDLQPLAFISDMEKGLGNAIRSSFPMAEHRVCLRHLWKNLKKHFNCPNNHKLRNLVWAAANAYTRHVFDATFAEVYSISPQIHTYLSALPYKWSRSAFSTEIKNHYNTNNMAESFNSWIGEARSKPVVDLVDMIRGMLMEQRVERKMSSERWRDELVPHIEEYIREITTRKEQFIVRQSTPYSAEVEGRDEREEVNISTHECSCRYWQLTGLPCIHAAAFIGSKEHPLWHIYVDNLYHVNRYRMAYDGAIATLPMKYKWATMDDSVDIGVPTTLRPRGRQKKNKI